MATSTSSIRANAPRRIVPIAIAVGALAFTSVRAQTEKPVEITIVAKTVKVLRYGFGVGAPEKQAWVTTKVKIDPVALTTRSGVALFKESVWDAARKACDAADPYAPVGTDDECVHAAVKAAKPQVNAVIKLARSSASSGTG